VTSVYTAGAGGICTRCHRPEAEHAHQAFAANPRACPPTDLAVYRTSDEGEHQRNVRMHLEAMSTPELVATAKRLSGECRAIMGAHTPSENTLRNTLRAMRLCQRCERPLVDHDDTGACPSLE
jgi:hypothetical protein